MVGDSLHASCLRIAQHLADGRARSGGAPCTFSVVGAGDLVRTPRQTINCTLYAYRFAQNQKLRSARPRELNGAPRIEYPTPGGPAVADVVADELQVGDLAALWRAGAAAAPLVDLRRAPDRLVTVAELQHIGLQTALVQYLVVRSIDANRIGLATSGVFPLASVARSQDFLRFLSENA